VAVRMQRSDYLWKHKQSKKTWYNNYFQDSNHNTNLATFEWNWR
jgi:hypothetical protein